MDTFALVLVLTMVTEHGLRGDPGYRVETQELSAHELAWKLSEIDCARAIDHRTGYGFRDERIVTSLYASRWNADTRQEYEVVSYLVCRKEER